MTSCRLKRGVGFGVKSRFLLRRVWQRSVESAKLVRIPFRRGLKSYYYYYDIDILLAPMGHLLTA